MTINIKFLDKLSLELQKYEKSKLLIVTKNQAIEDINHLISLGFNTFGENRVQEAQKKYFDLLKTKNIQLHLIGPLQRNKVKDALQLFDVIQSVDRRSLIDTLYSHINKNKNIKTKNFYLQINIGDEIQKSGLNISEIKPMYEYALSKKINIVGLMCIPPINENPRKYFLEMNKIRAKLNQNLFLSMGMSSDYNVALEAKSDMIRVGSSIFKN